MYKVLTIIVVTALLCACKSGTANKQSNADSIENLKKPKSRLQLLADKYDDDWKNEAELFTFDRYLIYYKGKKVGAKADDGFWYGTIKGDIYVEKGLQRFSCKEVIFKRLSKNKRSVNFLGRP